VADRPEAESKPKRGRFRPALAAVVLALAWTGTAEAVALDSGSLPVTQIVLALSAIALTWLVWYLVGKRREQEILLRSDIQRREAQFNLALWSSGDEFWDWNIRDNTIHRVGANQLLGKGSLETISTDDWRSNSIHPEDLPRVQGLLQEHIVGEANFFDSEHRVRNSDGEWIWVRSRGKIVERDAAGAPLRLSGTARNITAARRAERERQVALEVLRSMSEAVAVVSLDFSFISVNPSFSRITGYSEEEVVGQNPGLLDSSQHSQEFYRRVREVLVRTGHWAGEMWQKRKDDEEFLGWIELSEVRDSQGARNHFVAVVNDITDKKRAEQELRYLANYDSLTGLPNRALLSERLGRAIVRARRQESRLAVLFLDLDRFKDINDSLGHAAGDRLLKAAATRLQATLGASDTVARLGGDEFTVVLEDVASLEAVKAVASDILLAFSRPLEVDERQDVNITPSLGISLYPDHAVLPADLLKFADTAMYQAKAEGRNTYQIYSEEMDVEARHRAAIISHLHRALGRGELRLMYQPRMSLADGSITGVEALLRWHSPELGDLSPSVFIPLAEESGLILTIGEWVLGEACRQLKSWRRDGLSEISMGVNVSVLQLLRGDLARYLRTVLDATEIPANRLELELTESMVMQNAEQATAVLNEMRELGISLAIDDFGTGYSSLVYLKRLPIDTLKIDKEFIDDLTRDADDEAITSTIITMGHSLGLNVVAEGVETESQINFLRKQGCDEIQGHWLSKPLDGESCLTFIHNWSPDSALLALPVAD
jgi:diguanylate cyclase (GGDEF)-like protein/PAS domain S-box-containing protein